MTGLDPTKSSGNPAADPESSHSPAQAGSGSAPMAAARLNGGAPRKQDILLPNLPGSSGRA